MRRSPGRPRAGRVDSCWKAQHLLTRGVGVGESFLGAGCGPARAVVNTLLWCSPAVCWAELVSVVSRLSRHYWCSSGANTGSTVTALVQVVAALLRIVAVPVRAAAAKRKEEEKERKGRNSERKRKEEARLNGDNRSRRI